MKLELVHVFMLGMLLFGTINSLVIKGQDRIHAVGRDGKKHDFEHPAFQTFNMFCGEAVCLIAFFVIKAITKHKLQKSDKEEPLLNAEEGAVAPRTESTAPKKSANYPRIIFLIPTICDCLATACINVGFMLTYASVTQMLRGSVVLFTALFSVVFLKRKLRRHHWVGLGLIIVGIVVVGMASIFDKTKKAGDAKNPALGAIAVVCGQIFAASLFVVEEKYFSKFDIEPVEAVGWEGVFGVLTTLVLLPILQFIKVKGSPIEDSYDALIQMGNSPLLVITFIGIIFSIAFFNVCGISVTKSASATARSTIDTSRTLLIWAVCLILEWEHFLWLQVVGFVLLICGTLLYNEIVKVPGLTKIGTKGSRTKSIPLPANKASEDGKYMPVTDQ